MELLLNQHHLSLICSEILIINCFPLFEISVLNSVFNIRISVNFNVTFTNFLFENVKFYYHCIILFDGVIVLRMDIVVLIISSINYILIPRLLTIQRIIVLMIYFS